MPTYDYECSACKHTFELYQSITAAPVRKCPACGKNKVRRLLGMGAGVIFRGSGFYQTDYRSESYRKAAAKDNGETSGGGKDKKDGSKDQPAAAKPSSAKSGSDGKD